MKKHKKTNRVLSKKKQQLKSKIGKPPGTLIYVGEGSSEKPVITVVEYNEESYSLKPIDNKEDLVKYKNPAEDKVTWINIKGLSDVDLLTFVGQTFGIHALILEDIINSSQQPKIEYYGNNMFVVLKKMFLEDNQEVVHNHMAIWFTSHLVITFLDDGKEDFAPVLQRVEAGTNIFRKAKEDYLFYVLIDYIVDGYFLIGEEISERIENLQEELLTDPGQDDLHKVQVLKKEAHKARQAIRPVRDIAASIVRQESSYISESTLIYFRDTLDHIIQITEAFEIQRESITTLVDIYLSTVSNRMNEVMKVLTLIATIFIPLTFIAGVYGMNFTNMPELHWKYGYFVTLGVMLVVGIALGMYFKKKQWL